MLKLFQSISDLFGLSYLAEFLQQGGAALWLLGLVSVALLWLALDKFYFIYRLFPKLSSVALQGLPQTPRHSWIDKVQREALSFTAQAQLYKHLSLIRLLTTLCPMIGLLGTVLGMIEIFEQLAIQDQPNYNLLSGGIARATLPTMVGMVLSLLGLILHVGVQRSADKQLHLFNQGLRFNYASN